MTVRVTDGVSGGIDAVLDAAIAAINKKFGN
jgi:hypothetical protein